MKTEEHQQTPTEAAGFITGMGVGITRQAFRGKHISSAIIVLAAAILITGGSFIRHDDTKLFVQVVGCVVGVIGLGGWILSVPRD